MQGQLLCVELVEKRKCLMYIASQAQYQIANVNKLCYISSDKCNPLFSFCSSRNRTEGKTKPINILSVVSFFRVSKDTQQWLGLGSVLLLVIVAMSSPA